ncbi:putative ATP-dependent RNA helicase SoYb [Scaptodrosophila lebanonensis]|uniref:RNA helicase n=1 Tax=Drosophila lebanonensis TaxID=7225 RepID=A0A6J2TQE5_DROLE|nr:putative ATP-dependent RNA helicase SoYb [Scaptodrosophila lebanonensis]
MAACNKENNDHACGEPIIITHYVNPQLFWYTPLKKLHGSAAQALKLEKKLPAQCVSSNQLDSYEKEQHVIVRYKPQSNPQKYLRGVVKDWQDDEYLVWAMDYGFQIISSSRFLWCLPTELSEKIMDIAIGGVANVLPWNGKNWSAMAQKLFGLQLLKAHHLSFKPMQQNQRQQNFGQLLMKLIDCNEYLVDAAEYLVLNQFARIAEKDHFQLDMDNYWQQSEATHLAEINDIGNLGGVGSRNIIKLVKAAGLLPTKSIDPNNSPILTNGDSTFADIYFDSHKVLHKVEPWSQECKVRHRNGYYQIGGLTRPLTRPSAQPEKLSVLLQQRTVPPIPLTAKLLSKVSSKLDNPVETAFEVSSDTSSACGSSSSSNSDIEEDAPRLQCLRALVADKSTDSTENSAAAALGDEEVLHKEQKIIYPTSIGASIEVQMNSIPITSSAVSKEPLKTHSEVEKTIDIKYPNAVKSAERTHATPLVSKAPEKMSARSEFKQIKANENRNEKYTSLVKSAEPLHAVPFIYESHEKYDKTPVVKATKINLKADEDNKYTNLLSSTKPFPLGNVAETPNVQNRIFPKPQDPSLTKEKLDRIFNEMLGKTSLGSPLRTGTFNSSPKQAIPKNVSGLSHINNMVLAHSSVELIPLSNVQELPLGASIHQAMCNKNFHTPSPMQSYAWPHLMQGNSMLLINSMDTGRSWSYLPPLCTLVMQQMQMTVMTGVGPLAVLVANNQENVNILAQHCSFLLQYYETIKYKVINAGAIQMGDVCSMLLSTCGILVTTASCLVILLQHHSKGIHIFDASRLRHLIFDDYDLIRTAGPLILQQILDQLKGMSLPRLQLIMVAQQWRASEYMPLIKRQARNPLLLFGDFLEAAMYGSIKLEVVFMQSIKKLPKLLEFLDSRMSLQERTLIFCKSLEEVGTLRKALLSIGLQSGMANESQSETERILLLTDDLVTNNSSVVTLRDIQLLVHYNLSHSWSSFSSRFRFVTGNIPNYFSENRSEKYITSFIMLDETNKLELPRLVQFLHAHGIRQEKHIMQAAADCQMHSEQGHALCQKTLSVGTRCLMSCRYRHYLVKADVMNAPFTQQPDTLIRVQVVKVYSPVHLAIRPLCYKLPGCNKWRQISSSVAQLALALNVYMGIPENRRPYRQPRINDICLIERSTGFKRVRVVNCQYNGSSLQVQFMDDSTEPINVGISELLYCATPFQRVPPLVIAVRLPGIVPVMGEVTWSRSATQWVESLLCNLNELQHVQMVVDFALKSSVYVKDIFVIQDCPQMGTSVKKTMLCGELLREGYGCIRADGPEMLRNMYAEVTKINSTDEDPADPHFGQWLDSDEDGAEAELPASPTLKDEKQLTSPSPAEIVDNPDVGQWLDSDYEDSTPVETNAQYFKTQRDSGEDFVKQKKDNCKNTARSPEFRHLVDSQHSNTTNSIAIKETSNTSTTEFLNVLIRNLKEKKDDVKPNNTQQMMEEIVYGIDERLNTVSSKSSTRQSKKKVLVASHEKSVDAAALTTYSLRFSAVAGGAVRPSIKWKQTLRTIVITIEQQLPEYELRHNNNTLFYSVPTTAPPQGCILNLLGDVTVISEKQCGYYLQVKLDKVIKTIWPTLLRTAVPQHWLTYDTDPDGELSSQEAKNYRFKSIWQQCSEFEAKNPDFDSDSSVDESEENSTERAILGDDLAD